ncbi:UDP-N-acetylmuramyl pentapeptide phosphotransferase [Thermoanaerobacterium sp. RBIITD]|uniref:UDP-N-acetylmuramyl pentapeptide phosphotransferase n=1 Tax=Thermoanaerobacterium sp. RBIITD TaxID=1550240 RepID=UPI000BB8D64F|nr:UDP-N-acetylmuramyl pentapeptide phosphotransferase [Thermoanaerobacterium sp. RBIITD]SNX55383.1 UDP-N-acetylmuramyl pentapeptide phosphotransferase/UDP-N-acetylglucosamine-1-phosphate transferase [Thermoanaerobacterium sp. RBIITD]
MSSSFAFAISFLLMIIIQKFIIQILNKDVCLKSNYKKVPIPVCGGIAFIPTIFSTNLIINLIGYQENKMPLYLLSIILMSYVGLIDDLLGDRTVTGLMGHIKSLLHMRLTTGALKAITGFMASLYISINISKNIYDVFVNTFIIALFTNFLNLLDLRPGRAGKVFLLLSVIFLIIGKGNPLFLVIVLGASIAFLPIDLKAKIMLGDTGSNILGITLGISSVLIFNFNIRLILLILLVLIHIITEKYSLTKIIEGNKVLNCLDMLGRGREKN